MFLVQPVQSLEGPDLAVFIFFIPIDISAGKRHDGKYSTAVQKANFQLLSYLLKLRKVSGSLR